MEPTFRDFDAALAERRRVLAAFRLAGQRFEVSSMSFAALGALQRNWTMAVDDPSAAEALLEFIVLVLDPADEERFREAVKVSRIDFTGILELSAYLTEAATGFPSTPPSPSPASPSETSQSSMATLPPPVEASST